MIEINLLSEQEKTKSALLSERSKLIAGISILAVAVLLLLNVYAVSIAGIRSVQYRNLNKRWLTLKPQRAKVDEFGKLSAAAHKDALTLRQLVEKRVLWAEKLNSFSLDLPAGIWFNEISLSDKEVTVRGTVISLKKEEMALINLFLGNLKQDSRFVADFRNLDLLSVQRKTLAGYEVADFIFKGRLKDK